MSETIIKSQDRTDKHGEVYTPTWLVEQMLDKVDPSFWTQPERTVLEPSSGNGQFFIPLIKRFMAGLQDKIPDPQERFRHVIENQLYAVEIQQDNVEEMFDRIKHEFGYDARLLNHNITCANSLTMWFGEEARSSETLFDEFFG